ncbi:hypothetical protein [uncultured Methylobacterium sp.]|jgi:hypothetical protein|uniref:hypothetical protein n=1 Tax=uncultured Methylobacterium sp. TaxID=157278 RepID=UPI00262A85FA|nr:hypothetical protein [uncultured Methylobacterium sp.]
MFPALHLALAGLILAVVAACATSPASTPDFTPPPPRAPDAKTQLEYGTPAPRRY